MLKLIGKLLRKSRKSCAAVIVAAGSSNRMKGTDKILYQLGELPLIAHTIRAFQDHAKIKEIVVVTRADLISEIETLCSEEAYCKVSAVVEGGVNRMDSVMKGMDHIAGCADYVAIHDGARPFVTADIISATIDKAMEYHAAAPAVPVKDTIKVVQNRIVSHTPDRAAGAAA